VAEAIAQVQPYGVDVNSGVKGNDGFKNLQRLQAFIRSALSGTSS
jgi:phosphoribosylanthranilate isomerase